MFMNSLGGLKIRLLIGGTIPMTQRQIRLASRFIPMAASAMDTLCMTETVSAIASTQRVCS